MLPAPFIFRSIRWSAWEGSEAGLEHVEISPNEGGIDVSGVVIGRRDGTGFGLAFRLTLDALWHTRAARLQTTSGRLLHLDSDGQGHWRENGHDRPDLRGCLDIDIEATPLTNTLPIRRLAMKAGESVDIRLCYIAVPDLSVRVAHQRYTALRPDALYRFEALDHPFTADLPVDEDGFVLDYPGLFRRLA